MQYKPLRFIYNVRVCELDLPYSRLQAQLSRSMFPPAVSRILGVRFVRPSVRKKRDFPDFQITFFGVSQAPRDRTSGFLSGVGVSRKDPGEFWSVIPDVAHLGALDLGYIIEKSRKSTNNFENFQNFDFFESVPRHFPRVPGASTTV